MDDDGKLNYEKFMRYKKWHKTKSCILIDRNNFNLDNFTCDEAVHTLTIASTEVNNYGFRIVLGIDSALTILQFLTDKGLRFVRYLVFDGFTIMGYINNRINSQFFKTVFIKNIIYKNDSARHLDTLPVHKNIPNISYVNSHFNTDNVLIMSKYASLDIKDIINIKNINIDGFGEHKEMNDIYKHVADNRERYNLHMKKILWIYTRPGLFRLLPIDLIDIIISNIFLL
jgi:hypothetical protein